MLHNIVHEAMRRPAAAVANNRCPTMLLLFLKTGSVMQTHTCQGRRHSQRCPGKCAAPRTDTCSTNSSSVNSRCYCDMHTPCGNELARDVSLLSHLTQVRLQTCSITTHLLLMTEKLMAVSPQPVTMVASHRGAPTRIRMSCEGIMDRL
jgi:hypothetical protein